ncbi:MAG: GH25 family lysozyme [Candidatus Flemingiibacterium sp.]
MLKGIDVSTLQGNIDWSRIPADFVMVKATQGRGQGAVTRLLSRFTDSKFKRNIQNVRVPAGVYHYFTATDKSKALDEIDYYCSIIEPYRNHIRLWAALDVESYYLDGLGKTELTVIVMTALERIEARGYKPMLYTNPNYLRYRFEPHAFDEYDIWLAHYGVKTPYSVPNMKIWQYGTTRTDGISTDVDADYGYFDLDGGYKVGDKYTIRAGDRYTNGVAVPARLIGKAYTIMQVRDGMILLGEISSWVKV